MTSVDCYESSFEAEYGLRHHYDTILFSHGAGDQKRLQARFVLKRWAKAELRGEGAF
jgi:hypothetical protein